MKRLVIQVSLPLMLLVGLTLIGPQPAEAAKWRRTARRSYVHPPIRVAPPVRVFAPGVGVHVGPGVHVRAPGVRVQVGPRYPSYYRGSFYSRW
ncbi:MAG: hypothetical protein HQ581_03660 [Planctomycetes bacterium]|nr:hypothetical protein [Planctomycetota bacterium]